VAPVRGGVCLGCNTRRPTKSATRAGRVDTCERCGRILFLSRSQLRRPRRRGGTKSPGSRRAAGSSRQCRPQPPGPRIPMPPHRPPSTEGPSVAAVRERSLRWEAPPQRFRNLEGCEPSLPTDSGLRLL
jgi:hypothetical protein